MRLFGNIQKVTEAGTKLEIEVPASKALIITNHTKDIVFLYEKQQQRTGYPILKGESFEVKDILKPAFFFVEILDEDLTGHQGVSLISQTEDREFTTGCRQVNNSIIIGK